MTPTLKAHPDKNMIGRLFLIRMVARGLSSILPVAAYRVAARLFATPHRPPVPPREDRWAEGSRRFEVRTALGTVVARSWGDGPETVLLVHGWAGRGLQLGAFVEPLVANGFRVVAYDAPAHGASAGRRSSLIELAATANTVARELGPLAGVIAHSLGAAAVLRAVTRHELRAPRLALLAPATDFDGAAARFAELTGFTPAVIEGMWRLFERRLGFARSELALAALVAGAEVPMLIVHDLDDRDVPWEEGRALAKAAANARFVGTRGLGHRQLLRSPQVVERVCSFIRAGEADSAIEPAVEGALALAGRSS